ncbi:MAG: aldehyde dehydrogenase family protein, partial [Synergistaceae bacterium]|nr:aldehyde dehydrogenase family protein [Synergistaceae bacterium]
MQLHDKDLLSVQEVRELIAAAKVAQAELATKDQAYVDRLVKTIADAGVRNAVRLGRMANEDTGFGIPEDKTIKNVFASRGVYEYIKNMKTIGVIEHDDKLKVTTLAVPLGVIAGIIPSTNPTSTTLYKAEIAIKSGNSIVFSPHPQALRCILETVKVIRQAISEAGGNPDLVSCITIPTRQATDVLMSHEDTAMILATGGAAMVRAAYSSGTPAIGVGPGNGPAYIEKTADITLAVKRIMDSKTFDNGTICASEQSVVCDTNMASAVEAEMTRQGAYFLSDAERDQLGRFILRANGTMNPAIVGKNPQVIAELAGLTNVPSSARVLVAKET